MSQVFTFPYIPGWVKYVIISVLGGISSVILFLQSPPAGGATAASTAIFLLGLLVHDIESYNPKAPTTTTQVVAEGRVLWQQVKPIVVSQIQKDLAGNPQGLAIALGVLDTVENQILTSTGAPAVVPA